MGVHLTAEEDGPKPKAQGSARWARGSYGVQFDCCVGLVQRKAQVGGFWEVHFHTGEGHTLGAVWKMGMAGFHAVRVWGSWSWGMPARGIALRGLSYLLSL